MGCSHGQRVVMRPPPRAGLKVQTAFALLSWSSEKLRCRVAFGSLGLAPDQGQLREPGSLVPILRRPWDLLRPGANQVRLGGGPRCLASGWRALSTLARLGGCFPESRETPCEAPARVPAEGRSSGRERGPPRPGGKTLEEHCAWWLLGLVGRIARLGKGRILLQKSCSAGVS